jgi:putative hydrolase of HD superfamily
MSSSDGEGAGADVSAVEVRLEQPHPGSERLTRQLTFVLELDRLKRILRQTVLLDESRQENSAEHSWHLAMMVVVLHEYAAEPVDLARVLKMVLVHDVVEIDAGDTFCYDAEANLDKEEREHRAAERIFGLLPEEQARELRELWLEFEARETPEARFAAALDRLQPMMHNYHTAGSSWQRHGISKRQVLHRNSPMEEGAPELWRYAERFIEAAAAAGVLLDD